MTAAGAVAVCVFSDGGWNYKLLTIDTAKHAWGATPTELGAVGGRLRRRGHL